MINISGIVTAVFFLAIGLPQVIIAGKNDIPVSEINKDVVGRQKLYCATLNQSARTKYNSAGNLARTVGDINGAIVLYLEAIEEDPGYCDAMDNLGRLYRVIGDFEKAIYWYNKSISLQPDNPVSRMNLGVAYQHTNNYNLAIDEYKHLIRLDSSNPEGYYGIGQIKIDQKKYKDALKYLSIAEKYYLESESPLIIHARQNIAFTHYMLGDFKKSAQLYQSIYPYTKDDPNVNFMLGACFINGNSANKKTAKMYFLRAKELGAELPKEVSKILGIYESEE